METLSVRSAPAHFIHDVVDIHSHFETRAVNQHLSYFQDLMDQRKRGVAISALVDEQDKPEHPIQQIQRESLRYTPPSHAPTTTIPLSYDRKTPLESYNAASSSRPNESSSLSNQEALPSFSSLDYDSTKTSKLHEEILARHGHRERSQQLSPPTTVSSLRMKKTALETQTRPRSVSHIQSPVRSVARDHLQARQPHRLNDPTSPLHSEDAQPTRRRIPLASYPRGSMSSPRAVGGQRYEREEPLQTTLVTPLPVSPSRALENPRILSDILEKTHAEIASQHRRNDSAVDRGQSHQSLGLPLQPPSVPLYHLTSGPHNAVHLSHHQNSSSYAQLPPLHHQHHSSFNYGQPPTTFREHGRAIQSRHMPSNLTASTSNLHTSNVASRKRRGNLPREAVRLFKKWVEENKRYPYPNEAQKLDFERMTGLSMQQINNWFINARRRNLSERERAEMKREKERQSPSGSPISSRPESSHGLPDGDDFSLDSLSRQASHSRDHSGGGSMGY